MLDINPLEKCWRRRFLAGHGGAPDAWGVRHFPSRDEQQERVVSQMRKYSKPVVKTVEKGTIFAVVA